jgi:hypothetical protein
MPPPTPERPAHLTSTRSRRNIKPSLAAREAAESRKYSARVAITQPSPADPTTYEEALASSERDLWIAAIKAEFDSLARHQTWQLIPRPPNRKTVSTKWVFKLKDALPPRPKARLVARGFTQIPGEDYNDTYAPVVKASSIRTLFALAAQEALLTIHLDVETAFLNGDLEENILIEIPPGYVPPPEFILPDGLTIDDFVLRLNKALYGLKQASNVWATAFKNEMLCLGFTQSSTDDSIFISGSPESPEHIIVAIYVDDILVLAKYSSQIDSLITQLGTTSRIRNMGPVKGFLGMDIIRPQPHIIHISHRNSAQRILAKFDMETYNPTRVPFESIVPVKTAPGDQPTDVEQFRAITGSIIYLAVYTRPDIMFAASKLAQFNSNPSMQHYRAAAKHLLRYIQGTKDSSLRSINLPPPYLPGSAMQASQQTSTATNQPLVTFSSSRTALFPGNPTNKPPLRSPPWKPNTLHSQKPPKKPNSFVTCSPPSLLPSQAPQSSTHSQSALEHVKNNIRHARTKHIDTRHHFIRNIYTAGEIDLVHVPSDLQAADILTKALGRTKHDEALPLTRLDVLAKPPLFIYNFRCFHSTRSPHSVHSLHLTMW